MSGTCSRAIRGLMRLQAVSDLHLNHYKHYEKVIESLKDDRVGETILILAGDIVGLRYRDLALKHMKPLCQGYEQVLYVPGNHEFYGTDVISALNLLYTLPQEISNLTVLTSDNPVTIKGQRFLGDTMWFEDHPFNIYDQELMSDFDLIEDFVPWVYDSNLKAVRDFKINLESTDILITHHMPSHKSVHPKFARSSINKFFVCDIEDLIVERQPKMAIHGHTHCPFDYNIGKTRVFCNPLGYPREGDNPSFHYRMFIEI